MTPEQTDKFLGYVGQMFGRSYPADSAMFIKRELAGEPIEAAHKTVSQIKADGTKYLPSPVEIVKLVREWAGEIREQDARKEKRQIENGQDFLSKEQNKPLAKDSVKFIKAILTRRLDRKTILQGFDAMGNSHPGIGWDESKKDLQNFFDNNAK